MSGLNWANFKVFKVIQGGSKTPTYRFLLEHSVHHISIILSQDADKFYREICWFEIDSFRNYKLYFKNTIDIHSIQSGHLYKIARYDAKNILEPV